MDMEKLEKIYGKEELVKKLSDPESMPEGINREDYVIGTYLLITKRNWRIRELTRALAIEQSTGTWLPVPGETPEVRMRSVAKVVGIYEIPDYEVEVPEDVKERSYVVRIAFPFINFDKQLPMMLSTVVGNISLAGKIKVLDIEFPEDYVKGFKGPKFGISGVRNILNVWNRPLLLNMIKPCTGFPPDIGAQYFYEAARGGVDIIKDDELLADAPFNRIEERVVKYMEAADRANSEKGEKTLYTVNITDKYPKIIENAQKAIDLGVNALMVNVFTAGFSALQQLAEDESIKVPILAHMDFAGTMYQAPEYGITSPIILGKLTRISGADMMIFPAPYGKAFYLKEKAIGTGRVLTDIFYHIRPTFPAPSGGIAHPMVPDIIQDLGRDVIIAAGGAIHGFSKGPAAGARAFRYIIDGVLQGKSLDQMEEESEEVRVAIEDMMRSIRELRKIVGE
ncbi:MAG: RuBisCO large subunit C-terminal-like domain-containing protein [Thermoplasmata archaeon]